MLSRSMFGLAVVLGGAIAIAVPASAQVAISGNVTARGDRLDTGERPFLLTLGLGSTLVFSNSWRGSWNPSTGTAAVGATGAGFLLQVEVGGHLFSVDDHPGLFLLGSLAWTPEPIFGGRWGARVGFDIRVVRFEDADVTLLISPSVLVGFALMLDLGGLIAIEPAVDVHIVFVDGRFGVWLRPVAIDMEFLSPFSARWNFLVGAELRL